MNVCVCVYVCLYSVQIKLIAQYYVIIERIIWFRISPLKLTISSPQHRRRRRRRQGPPVICAFHGTIKQSIGAENVEIK